MPGDGLRLVSFGEFRLDQCDPGLTAASTDGGGARSLSQLKIMDNTILRLQNDLYPDDPDKVLLPCECFDLMGGSDTGACVLYHKYIPSH
jgi:hypothetical protein